MRISDWSSDVCSSDLVVPMAIATGPGAEMRQALGVTVFSGMLGVTLFGLFLTPVFYVTIRGLTRRLRPARRAVEVQPRSEERRVGKECVSTCRSRRSTSHSTKTKEQHSTDNRR